MAKFYLSPSQNESFGLYPGEIYSKKRPKSNGAHKTGDRVSMRVEFGREPLRSPWDARGQHRIGSFWIEEKRVKIGVGSRWKKYDAN